MKKTRTVLVVIICLLLSGIIVYGSSLVFEDNTVKADIINEKSLVEQEILSYDDMEKDYSKIYYKGQLIGVITDRDYLDSLIAAKYIDYQDVFPGTKLGLGEDLFIVEEKSFANFADVDDKIMDYLVENNLLGVETTAVEFSTADGTYEIIYVRDYKEFEDALRKLR